MPLSTVEYLDHKGAVELICEIDPYGSQFDELVEQTPVSRPTISLRLEQGREAGLFEREVLGSNRGTTHLHVLTDKGARLRLLFDDNGVTADYRNYKTALQRFQEKEKWVYQFIDSDPEELKPERGSVAYLHSLKNRPDYSRSENERDN